MPIDSPDTGGREWLSRAFMAVVGLVGWLKARVQLHSRSLDHALERIDDLEYRVTQGEEKQAHDRVVISGLRDLLAGQTDKLQGTMTEHNKLLVEAGRTPRYTADDWDITEQLSRLDEAGDEAVRILRYERERQQKERIKNRQRRQSYRDQS